MPIIPSISVTRLSQAEFKDLAHEVMGHVFSIHRDFGRFFDEQIYKKELATWIPGIHLEASVEVTHHSFSKTYFADVIAPPGGLFEFKAVDAIHPRHRSQVIHYLLLFDLSHGKIVNMRPEQVHHEFINCHARLAHSISPVIETRDWSNQIPGADVFQDVVTGLCRDWGIGLELALYLEAVTHFLGGEQAVHLPVPVFGASGHLADQRMHMASPDVAFKLTALTEDLDDFASHAAKLVRHSGLKAILWANLAKNTLRFSMLR